MLQILWIIINFTAALFPSYSLAKTCLAHCVYVCKCLQFPRNSRNMRHVKLFLRIKREKKRERERMCVCVF